MGFYDRSGLYLKLGYNLEVNYVPTYAYKTPTCNTSSTIPKSISPVTHCGG